MAKQSDFVRKSVTDNRQKIFKKNFIKSLIQVSNLVSYTHRNEQSKVVVLKLTKLIV